MTYYRKTFPEVRVILKQHLLENHVVEWMEQFGFGMGFHGEQGVESIHAQMNNISVNMRGIVDPLKQTLAQMEEHLTWTSPAIQVHMPPVKSRKRKLDT